VFIRRPNDHLTSTTQRGRMINDSRDDDVKMKSEADREGVKLSKRSSPTEPREIVGVTAKCANLGISRISKHGEVSCQFHGRVWILDGMGADDQREKPLYVSKNTTSRF
jgi:hypothetical protein